MGIKINDIVSKTDWVKIGILLVVSGVCWTWIYVEYQKPIYPEEWNNPVAEVSRIDS